MELFPFRPGAPGGFDRENCAGFTKAPGSRAPWYVGGTRSFQQGEDDAWPINPAEDEEELRSDLASQPEPFSAVMLAHGALKIAGRRSRYRRHAARG